MSRCELRRMTADHLDKAYGLEAASYTEEAAATMEAFRYRLGRYPGCFWGAWIGGRLVGIVNGVRTFQEDTSSDEMKGSHQEQEEGPNFCILTVAVSSDSQRKGIGSLLVRQIVQSAVEDGLASIILMCEEHLIPFYEQLGFEYLGESSSRHGGIAWFDMRMSLHGRDA
ncbi:GNAT family N-acetyltransferase [Paenibacillus tarimensis]|uniref:GNAT family N-acetyltransferase n=1 Tax=Paenibacillus tarimensis TaxID=416012 RepID=UPI001F2F3A73|nr:GNAT family N-acetyltransferase [Paenibacillus tarimensis]